MKPIELAKPAIVHDCLMHENAGLLLKHRTLPEETPVAFVYDGTTEAVMMATPADLEDFAVGFSVTEGLISDVHDIAELTVAHSETGIELRIWLAKERGATYRQRRRRLAGPTGCGLCGIESLAEIQRAIPPVRRGARLQAAEIIAATARLMDLQILHRETHATHAAAFFRQGEAMLAREDVGRHNALDKLVGGLRHAAIEPSSGMIVISSRVSVEMVQKAAMAGTGILVANSVPTALAVRTADMAGVTLIAVARGHSFEVFTHAERVLCDS